jgi:23S rRNA (adenine2030-N6)-methyltransferase
LGKAPSSGIGTAAFPRRAHHAEPPGRERRSRRRGSDEETPLNYRHHFHAGNFADLLKHAMLLDVLYRSTAAEGPLTVVDTHAGAGLYDLEGEAARRSGEAAAGVVRLMAAEGAPAVFDPVKAAVKRANPAGTVRYYPGSPLMVVQALSPGDRYLGCELLHDDQAALQRLLGTRASKGVQAQAMAADGYEVLEQGEGRQGRRLVLIDPPFERGDEYPRILQAVAADARRAGEASYLIWTPLKDLQTFDSFLGGVEALGLGGGLAVEARLRPLTDPLKMNGCAMILLGPPRLRAEAEPAARAAAEWIAAALGEAGAAARIERLA